MPMSRLASVQAIVFDAYGTLFDVHSPMQRRRALIGDKADLLSETWRRKQLEYSWLRTLMGRYVDFWTITGQSLDYAMASCGIDDLLLRADLMQTYLSVEPYPETLSTIEGLKANGRRLAILSNGSTSMLTAAVNNAAISQSFEHILSADEAQAFKPHPNVYRLACERLDLPASEIAFLSSNGWDAAGAATFGFPVIWVNRHGAPVEALPDQPLATLTRLDELPALLGLAPGGSVAGGSGA